MRFAGGGDGDCGGGGDGDAADDGIKFGGLLLR